MCDKKNQLDYSRSAGADRYVRRVAEFMTTAEEGS